MSLQDKAKKLDFSQLPSLGSPATTARGQSGDPGSRPKTAPGAMMAFANDQRSELLVENERLRQEAGEAAGLRAKLEEANNDLQQWEGAKAGLLLDPRKIRRSRWANRHQDSFIGAEYESLKQEISSAGGNVQPIKVRRINEGELEYEIVFGHRRHQACLELGLPVLALVDNVSDTDLFLEMERENRVRKDLSPFEQGTMYRRALDEGLFPSNRKLAEAVGADLSAVGKALSLADLPPPVLEAFSSPLELQYRWAKPLTDALDADREGVLERASALRSFAMRLPAKAVFEQLLKGKPEGAKPTDSTSLATSIAIQVGGAKAGAVTMDAKGRAVVEVQAIPITSDLMAALAKAVESFLGKQKPRK
jgi:ParB family chromosome partitioning protein